MSNNPGSSFSLTSRIIESKGFCHAGHQVGDILDISCHKADGICGFFYYSIFPDLQTFEFGGKLPWWEDDAIEVGCPDTQNQVILRIERSRR